MVNDRGGWPLSRERLPTGNGIFGGHGRPLKPTFHLSVGSPSAGWDSLAECARCADSGHSPCAGKTAGVDPIRTKREPEFFNLNPSNGSLILWRSRHLPRDNLPVFFLLDPNHRPPKVDRTERLSAERPLEGEQKVNNHRIPVHMYLSLFDVN
jgi:hypothetical protein